MKNNDDVSFLKRIKNGDWKVFTELMKDKDELLYKIAYSVLRDKMHAEDAVMSTYEELLLKASSIRKASALDAWLKTTVYRKSLNILKENKFSFPVTDYSLCGYIDAKNTETPDFIEQRHITDCMTRLPTEHFDVLMYWYNGMKLREIAEMTDKSMAQVRLLLKKSKTEFLKFYKT